MANGDMDVEQISPLDKIYTASGTEGFPQLQKHTLELPCDDGLIDQDGLFGGITVDNLLDLSFLSALRSGDDDFVPEQLFLRQEVEDMFKRLAVPHEGKLQRRILTGSAGIGKSVVFFLAALQLAFTSEKRVIYLRKVQEVKTFSIFVLEKNPDDGRRLDVVFAGDISPVEIKDGSVSSMVRAIIHASELRAHGFYIMVDGPKHDAPADDLLLRTYSALCTSGGYPASSQAAIDREDILVMSGWTDEKLKLAMRRLNITEVEKKYELAGGRIRLVLCSNEKITRWFDNLISSLGQDDVVLALTSDVASGCMESKDRLRTRFFDDQTGEIKSRMIVDSRYAFNKLKGRLEGKDILAAYDLAWGLGLKAASGWFYEEILHRRFKELTRPTMDPRIKEWIHQDDISGVGGVASFVEKCQQSTDIYWCPPISNFANIDAAVYDRSCTLICYQYTVQGTHTFDRDTFWMQFVNHLVIGQVSIKRVRVVFVTPSEVSFDMNSHHNYEQNVQTGQTRSSPIPVSFFHVSVDAQMPANKVVGTLLHVNG